MKRYDREPQARRDPITGETYYLHAPESRRGERGSGYVDPTEEFGARAHEYRPEEIEGFERAAALFARKQAERPDLPRPPAPERVEIAAADEPTIESGPFASFTRKLERLLRPHNAVREIVGSLGPLRGAIDSPREILEARGGFFLREEAGEEHYAMMKDPAPPIRPIEEESFDADEGSLESLIQERLRFAVRLAPAFSYRFYFV